MAMLHRIEMYSIQVNKKKSNPVNDFIVKCLSFFVCLCVHVNNVSFLLNFSGYFKLVICTPLFC